MAEKKKDSMAGMTAAQKAASMRGGITELKDLRARRSKVNSSIPFLPVTPEMRGDQGEVNRLGRQITDRSRTIGRLESRGTRSAGSAKYRAVQQALAKKKGKK